LPKLSSTSPKVDRRRGLRTDICGPQVADGDIVSIARPDRSVSRFQKITAKLVRKKWRSMKQMSIFALAAVAAACVLASLLFTAVRADDEGCPIFGVKIPAGYCEWELIAVSHEAGLDELPFPDGTIPPSSPGNMCR
jgi:hypothetical protein